MNLTKSHLKQLIKEEIDNVLNEQKKKKCRPLKGAYALLWSLLQKNQNHPSLSKWRGMLKGHDICPEGKAHAIPIAEELIDVVKKYWHGSAPGYIGWPDIHKEECVQPFDPRAPDKNIPACKNLKIILKMEADARKKALKHPKYALSYLQNFLGTIETAKITQKYPVI